MIFQNLSHELKTPISVIQSYIEGIQDNVVDKDEAIKMCYDNIEHYGVKELLIKYLKNNNEIDEVIRILKDDKQYVILLGGIELINNEFITKLLSSVRFD